MIALTRLKGQVVALNPDLIVTVDATPDTVVRLSNGDSIVVLESIDEIIKRVTEFRRSLFAAFGTDPTRAHGTAAPVAMKRYDDDDDEDGE